MSSSGRRGSSGANLPPERNPASNAKTALVEICQRLVGRSMGKDDIVYEVTQLETSQYQATCALNCIDGKTYAGEVCADCRLAEQAAAHQALGIVKHDIAVRHPGVDANQALDSRAKGKLYEAVKQILQRPLETSDIVYDFAPETEDGNQATLTLPPLPGSLGQQTWFSDRSPFRKDAMVQAAAAALASIMSDPLYSDLDLSAAPTKEVKKQKEKEMQKKGSRNSSEKGGAGKGASSLALPALRAGDGQGSAGKGKGDKAYGKAKGGKPSTGKSSTAMPFMSAGGKGDDWSGRGQESWGGSMHSMMGGGGGGGCMDTALGWQDPWSAFLIDQLVNWSQIKQSAAVAAAWGKDAGKGMWQKGDMGGYGKAKSDGKSKAGHGKGKGRTKTIAAPMAPSPREVVTGQIIGTVLEWRGKFGYITPDQPIDHPSASRNNGRIFLKATDLKDDTQIKQGDAVCFEVYCDDVGLGAQDVTVM